jgi:hypothetical protein
LFGSHQPIKLKKDKSKNKSSDYYLITKVKEAQEILNNSLIKTKAVN